MFSFRLLLGALAAVLLFISPAWSQANIWTVTGDATYDGLGMSVDLVGDINGDGIPEIVVGAPLDDNNGQDCGLARVVDGATGLILFTYDGDATRDEYGAAVAGVGDIDGDGTPDFAVSAPVDDNNGAGSGMVRIYSGANGTVIRQLDGLASNDAFGWSISYLGDVDGDGRDDLLVGANQKPGGASTLAGYVEIFSGATGASLAQIPGSAANDQMGYDVAGGEDLNSDGVNDFLVGIYGDDTNGLNAGAIQVYSGASFSLIWTAFGDATRDHLGASVAFMGDLTGDGVAEVIAGAPEDDNVASDGGSIRIFDGATGAIVATVHGQQATAYLGESVSGCGDVTGDGIPDFLGGASRFDGASGADCGKVSVFDGATFTESQFAIGDRMGDRLGFTVLGLPDINGDGIPDYLSGARQYGGAGGNAGPGLIRTFDPTGTPPPPPPRWPNLPSAFLAVGSGMNENFDTIAGTLPSHMAVNELNELLRTPDPDAWANLGQNAPCMAPFSGAFNLELGGNPNMASTHFVANSLILGLDGGGSTSLVLDYQAINYGEESNTDDGIFLSSDGTNWEVVTQGWGHVSTTMVWEATTGTDLTGTSVDTSGPFYLLIGQADNFPFANVDGIGIDDISVHDAGPTGPTLGVNPMPPVAGQSATIFVTGNNPGDVVFIGYSLTGGGPTNTPFGPASMSMPIRNFPPLIANANGDVGMTANVPMIVQGRPIWMQAGNVNQAVLSNGLNFTFL